VTVVDELTGRISGISKSETVANIVETSLKEEQNNVPGDSTTATGFRKVSTELLLKDTVDELKFLFLAKSDCVVGLFATSGAESMRTWRVVTAFESFRWPKEGHSKATINLIFWAGITCH
jgi:hypothetical protein